MFSLISISERLELFLNPKLSNEMIMTRELFVILLISSVKTYNINKEYFIHCMKIASICKYV